MNVHYANWTAPKHVRALTTTVDGGVSDGVYHSLNLGQHVQDDVGLVEQNRALLVRELSLPSEPVWLNQAHSTDVVELMGAKSDDEFSVNAEGSLTNADGSLINADGSYTHSKGVVCAVLTADCLPVFLTNKVGDRVAVVHAGWRGLADGIIEQGVAKLGCPAEDVIAWAGPCIGPDAFEIGDEVREQLGGSDAAYKESLNSSAEKTKWFANLYLLAGERLSAIGVNEYFHSHACTFNDSNEFFSYRRTGQCGRMASLIWVESSL